MACPSQAGSLPKAVCFTSRNPPQLPHLASPHPGPVAHWFCCKVFQEPNHKFWYEHPLRQFSLWTDGAPALPLPRPCAYPVHVRNRHRTPHAKNDPDEFVVAGFLQKHTEVFISRLLSAPQHAQKVRLRRVEVDWFASPHVPLAQSTVDETACNVLLRLTMQFRRALQQACLEVGPSTPLCI